MFVFCMNILLVLNVMMVAWKVTPILTTRLTYPMVILRIKISLKFGYWRKICQCFIIKSYGVYLSPNQSSHCCVIVKNFVLSVLW